MECILYTPIEPRPHRKVVYGSLAWIKLAFDCLLAALQVLENWTQRGILDRLDRRKLQQELDLHKLFLLTSFHAQGEVF